MGFSIYFPPNTILPRPFPWDPTNLSFFLTISENFYNSGSQTNFISLATDYSMRTTLEGG